MASVEQGDKATVVADNPEGASSSGRWGRRRGDLLALLRALPSILPLAWRRFSADRGLGTAASLSFTLLLAFVPLLTVGFALLSAFPAVAALRSRVQQLVFESFVPSVGSEVKAYVDGFVSNAGALTGFGIVLLAITAILLFFSIEAAFNAIWRARSPRPMAIRLLSIWAMLTVAPLLLGLSLSLSGWVAELLSWDVQVATGPLRIMLPILLEAATFALMYLIIPAREVRWRDAAVGGLVAALALEVSKWAFVIYLEAFPTYKTIYGALSAVPIFLVWLFTMWSIVLFGAQVAAVLPEWRAGRVMGAAPENLLPAQRLMLALAVLEQLHKVGRAGVGMKRQALLARLPFGSVLIDGTLEQLSAAHWVTCSDRGAWVSSRDLHRASLADLRGDLGYGLKGDVAALTIFDGPWRGRAAELIARSEYAGRAALDLPIALLLEPPRRVGEDV